jgi:hypothetical protein
VGLRADLGKGAGEMTIKENLGMKDIPHEHVWVPAVPKSQDLDKTGKLVYLYRCAICGRTTRTHNLK